MPDMLDNISNNVTSLVQKVTEPCFLLFEGEMGVGKTTFIKELLKHFGFDATRIQSPTFNLVFEHTNNAGKKAYHFDLYRLEKPYEADDFFMEYLERFQKDVIVCVEWSERLSEAFRQKLIHEGFCIIKIEVGEDNKRNLIFNNSSYAEN